MEFLRNIFPCLFRLHYIHPRITIKVNGDQPEKLKRGIAILKKVVPTKEFKKFSAPFPDVYKELIKDWEIDIIVDEIYDPGDLNRPMSISKKTKVIKYRSYVADHKPDNEIAAILLHEYIHKLGIHHENEAPGTPGYYFQFEFEKWLNTYNR